MSVSLTYYSQASVSDSALASIKQQAEELSHSWWAEGINFFPDPNKAGRAYGDTKLFRLDVDPVDDSAMAWRDAQYIVEQLELWSNAHGIEWRLSCEGSEIGAISSGRRDEEIAGFLGSMLEISEMDEPVTPERLRRIDEAYRDR